MLEINWRCWHTVLHKRANSLTFRPRPLVTSNILSNWITSLTVCEQRLALSCKQVPSPSNCMYSHNHMYVVTSLVETGEILLFCLLFFFFFFFLFFLENTQNSLSEVPGMRQCPCSFMLVFMFATKQNSDCV